jgi:PrtD family type I secretion system ABC transporter
MISDARAAIWASLRVLFAVALFSMCINVLMLALPLYTMQSFDRVLPSRSMDTLAALTVLVVALTLVMSVVEVVRSKVLVRLSCWFDHALSARLLRVGVEAASQNRRVEGGSLLRDLGTVRGFLTGGPMLALLDAPWMPLFLGIMFLVHPLQGAVATGGAVVLVALALLNQALTNRPLETAGAIAAAQMTSAAAFTRKAEVIQAMGMLTPLLERWQERNVDGLYLHAQASDRAGWMSGLTKAARMLVQVALMGVGLYLALNHEITGGAMIASSIIMGRALAPVEQLVGAWRQVAQAREAYARINKALREHRDTRSSTQFADIEGGLTVDGVGYTYAGASRLVLNGVAFALEPGDALGIVGPTAAGKSTLARLLVGLWPATMGKVRLGGIDVHGWERGNFGRFCGYLPQEVDLFAGTVKDNIARMTAAGDDAVIAAARAANAHAMILGLPNGYDTLVGEGGANLSGGQRQRIGLARALFADPVFLVLDEPNANLDTEGEAALVDAVAQARLRQAIVVVISHRSGLLNAVNKMLVLGDGRVQAFGDRDAVLGQLNQQQRFAAAQAKAPRLGAVGG